MENFRQECRFLLCMIGSLTEAKLYFEILKTNRRIELIFVNGNLTLEDWRIASITRGERIKQSFLGAAKNKRPIGGTIDGSRDDDRRTCVTRVGKRKRKRNDSFAPTLFPRSLSFLFVPPPPPARLLCLRYEITPDLERRALSLVLLAALSRKLLAADAPRGLTTAQLKLESRKGGVMYSLFFCVSRTCFARARVREMQPAEYIYVYIYVHINIHALSLSAKTGEAAS